MSKKFFPLFSLMVVVAMILAACAPKAEPTAAPEEAAPAETAAPEEPMAKCEDEIGCVEIKPGEPVHIAYALTVSGATAPLGEDSKGAIEIAIDDKGGELFGHPIALTGEDTLCSAEGGQAAGTKISADPSIVGVIGTNCSGEARAAMPLIAGAGMVMISPSNTNPDLTNPEHPDHHVGYFRTAHNDLFQGAVAAEFAYNVLGLKKAATIHDGSPYAESLQQVFADVFIEQGGEITAQEAVNVGDTDMKPVLTSIATGAPEIIYFPIFEPEGPLVAAQAKDVPGLEATILMGADGLFADTFPEATGSAADGMYLSGPYVSPENAEYAAFLAKWGDKFGGVPPSGFHAHAYDATNILLNAIEAVAIQDGETLWVPRKALRDAIFAVEDFAGLTGKLTCDENGDCATGEALAVFLLGQAEVDGAWPPPVYWQPGKESVATAPAVACEDDPLGCVTVAPGEPINIAYALTVSGATAPLGEDSKGAIEIAIDDKGGELFGHPIALTGEDTLCSAEGGQAAGTKISADPTIVGVIGTNCSSEARAAMPLIAGAGMVMISPSNTNPDLTNPEHPDHHIGYFRTAHNDLFQGAVAAEFAYNELGLKKAATIHDGSPYAESLQAVFADRFKELGGEITAQEAVNVGDTDMKPVLTSIATGAPEIIYFPIFEPEGPLVAAQAKDVPGLEATILMGADGLFADTFPEASGSAAVGMYLSGPYVSPENVEYAAFLAKWGEKFGGVPPSGFHAHAYDATNILLNAIEKIAVVEADGTVKISRTALREAIFAVKDFAGLTGKLTCDENGDCATGEALAVFLLGQAEVDGAWPPPVYWQLGK